MRLMTHSDVVRLKAVGTLLVAMSWTARARRLRPFASRCITRPIATCSEQACR